MELFNAFINTMKKKRPRKNIVKNKLFYLAKKFENKSGQSTNFNKFCICRRKRQLFL